MDYSNRNSISVCPILLNVWTGTKFKVPMVISGAALVAEWQNVLPLTPGVPFALGQYVFYAGFFCLLLPLFALQPHWFRLKRVKRVNKPRSKIDKIGFERYLVSAYKDSKPFLSQEHLAGSVI